MEEWKPLVDGFDDVSVPAGSDAAGVFYDEFYTRSGGDCGSYPGRAVQVHSSSTLG